MPEGDTIWRTAAALRGRLVGRTVRRSSHEMLQGRTIEAVDSQGKHLFIHFTGSVALHTHMGMTGSWYVHRPGERWRRPAWKARVVLECDDVVAVCFSPPVAEVVRSAARAAAHLGPDLLQPDTDLDQVVQRARALGGVPLGELLLDQRVCSGVGNVYKSESLWARRLDPWAAATTLTDEELRDLFRYAQASLRVNLQGSYQRRFPGHGRAAVHGRRGRPCPRCGTLILARQQGDQGRWTYFCPQCQEGTGTVAPG